MISRPFHINVRDDPSGGLACIACLHRALLVALEKLGRIDEMESAARLAQLEAEVMSEIKNIVPNSPSEAEEVRAMSIGHEAVRATFDKVRKALTNRDPGAP